MDFFTNDLCQADSQMEVLSSGQMVQLQVVQIAKINRFMLRHYIMTDAAVKINDFFSFSFCGGITPFQGDSFQTYKLIHLAQNVWKVLDVHSTQIQGFTGSSPLGWQRCTYTMKYSIM